MQHKVFLSYSSIDTLEVDKLVDVLRRLGLSVIRDTYAFQPGDDIDKAISRVVSKEADVVAVAMSNNSLTSPWVQKEERAAQQARAFGRPLDILYINISPDTNVPDRIRKRIYVDLAPRRPADYALRILDISRFFLRRPALRRLGVYDVYSELSDLDSRRENATGEVGCTIDQYLSSASDSIVAVGLWFGVLFGMDQASTLAQRLRDVPGLRIDLYIPDPDIAPMAQLAGIHESAHAVIDRIPEFVEQRFTPWGAKRGLDASQAQRCQLHFLRYIPTASFLCVDAVKPTGRIILDLYTPRIKPSDQLKVELRYPRTPVYQKYLQSLAYIQSDQSVTRSIPTSYT